MTVKAKLNTLWRWFFWGVVLVGVLFVLFIFVFIAGLNRPNIMQSDGFTSVTPEAKAFMLSHSLPETATNVRYCDASVGMVGYLKVYRFTAPVPDLHKHAQAEFAALSGKPAFKTTSDVTSPITDHQVASYKKGYGVDVDWMLPQPNVKGTLYEPADGQYSHRPTIFIDETNGVLYFQMTD